MCALVSLWTKGPNYKYYGKEPLSYRSVSGPDIVRVVLCVTAMNDMTCKPFTIMIVALPATCGSIVRFHLVAPTAPDPGPVNLSASRLSMPESFCVVPLWSRCQPMMIGHAVQPISAVQVVCGMPGCVAADAFCSERAVTRDAGRLVRHGALQCKAFSLRCGRHEAPGDARAMSIGSYAGLPR